MKRSCQTRRGHGGGGALLGESHVREIAIAIVIAIACSCCWCWCLFWCSMRLAYRRYH